MLCSGHALCLFVSCSAHNWSNSCFRRVDDQTPNNPPAGITNTAWHALLWQIQLNFTSSYMAIKEDPQAGSEHALSVFLKNEPVLQTKAEGWSLIMDELKSIHAKTHLSFSFDSLAESVCTGLILSHKIILQHDDNVFKHCLIDYIHTAAEYACLF